MVNSSRSKEKLKNHKVSVVQSEIIDNDSEQEAQHSAEPITTKQSSVERKNICGVGIALTSLVVSGIIGGLITVSFWIGIQKAGFLPSFLVVDRFEEEKNLQITIRAKEKAEETEKQLNHVLQQFDTLKKDFSSFSSQRVEAFQEDESFQKERSKVFTILEKKVDAFEKYVQALTGISEDIKTALFVGQSNKNDIIILKQRLDNIQKEIVTQNNEKDGINTAMFVAVSALKNAIDRGGSYVRELETVQHFSPSIAGFDLLQKTASTGLPSPAKLSADFAYVADKIVGTQNSVVPNADFLKKVEVWIKSLIVSRPIGYVEGTTVPAVVARMEVAIQAGDYEKALAEWQTLPQNAKDISVDFIDQLKRHLAVHHVLQQMLIVRPKRSSEAAKM
ncbi:COG4223 family protein [Bartonella sp. C271]|uniref:COG4223 family protein n=1 Tax=Bartonella sp. C271 TaxID=3070220 RepID=UPI0038B45A67